MKADGQEIAEKIQELLEQSWLGESRKWWPKFLFHFSDINNIVNILETEIIKSRSQIQGSSDHKVDIASQAVLSSTNQVWKTYVRFYFRPRTPMLHQIEGFRPLGTLIENAHCPMPIYLIFNSIPILQTVDVKFSDGNLASSWRTKVGDTAEFLGTMPFENIYHDGSLHELGYFEKKTVLRNRQAEVIVPNEIDLTNLRAIYCRSQAEFETLVHLLSESAYQRWKTKIGVASRVQLFFEKELFIRRVNWDRKSLNFELSRTFFPSGPFNVDFKVRNLNTGVQECSSMNQVNLQKYIELPLSDQTKDQPIEVGVEIDSHVAYANFFGLEDMEIPF